MRTLSASHRYPCQDNSIYSEVATREPHLRQSVCANNKLQSRQIPPEEGNIKTMPVAYTVKVVIVSTVFNKV